MVLMGSGGGLQMNKFKRVSYDHHVSLADGRFPGLMSRGEGVPYHVAYPIIQVMCLTPHPTQEQNGRRL